MIKVQGVYAELGLDMVNIPKPEDFQELAKGVRIIEVGL